MNVLQSCVVLLKDVFLLYVSFEIRLYIIVIYSVRDLYVFVVKVFSPG